MQLYMYVNIYIYIYVYKGSAEDALNARDIEIQQKAIKINQERVIHMKQWQKDYTANQQVRMQEELKVRTGKGEYGAMFTMIKVCY
jgi:Rieske Fe-S protein